MRKRNINVGDIWSVRYGDEKLSGAYIMARMLIVAKIKNRYNREALFIAVSCEKDKMPHYFDIYGIEPKEIPNDFGSERLSLVKKQATNSSYHNVVKLIND